MNVAKMLLTKLGHFIVTLLGMLRRALCCFRRRRRMSDSALPMTNHDLGCRFSTIDQNGTDLQNWDSWADGETMSVQVDDSPPAGWPNANRFDRKSFSEDKKSDDDVDELFKDMVPTIRRTKKYIMKSNAPEDNQNFNQSSRLAVDIKATSSVYHNSTDLGMLDDHVETWEDVTDLEEHWSPETALREQKLAERERRLADHQRRKMEKEQGRSSRTSSVSTRPS